MSLSNIQRIEQLIHNVNTLNMALEISKGKTYFCLSAPKNRLDYAESTFTNLPSTKKERIVFKLYRHSDTDLYIASYETDEDKKAFIEMKAVAVGLELLELQKQVLAKKTKYLEVIKELAEAKKQMERAQ